MYFRNKSLAHGEGPCSSGVGPVQSSVWPRRRYMGQKRTCSPSLLVAATLKEGGGWAEPSSLAEQKFPGLQVYTSIKRLKLWLCGEPPLPAAKEY